MTISYTREVATCTGLGSFWKLLFRWRGSIYKLVWSNLLMYLICFFSLSLIYRFGLGEYGKDKFEQLSLFCAKFADLIPVTFVLGFYVSIIITRWWGQYKVIPWPDSCCLFVSTVITGQDERGRLMRRTIARYLIVALIQVLRMTSIQVKKRFPTLTHLSEAGILTDEERKCIEAVDEKCIQHPKYWMSLVWAGAVVTRARKEGRIKDDYGFQTIIREINNFRSGCGGLLDYDWISVPLVYTQVVTLAVYSFFISSLMGRQFLDPAKKLPGNEVDLVVPIFTFLQFFFYMGWLKVAEALINPFGEDDDDFEMNWLIDRNLQVAYLIVDDMHCAHPELIKDQFWDDGIPDELPYTVAAEAFRPDPWMGSTAEVEVSAEDAEICQMDRIDEEEEDDEERNGEVIDSDEENLLSIRVKEKTDPVPINNGGVKNTPRDSMKSSMSTLAPGGSRGSQSNSVLNLLNNIFSRSTAQMSRVGSVISMSSRAPRNRRTRTTTRRRKVSTLSTQSNTGKLSRTASRVSNVSSGNMTPKPMSRVHTKENELFKMSDNSSVNSFHTESEFPSRSNSDAHALYEVREILKKDLNKYHSVKGEQPPNLQPMESKEQFDSKSSIRSDIRRRGEQRPKPDNFNYAKVLKKKLEQVHSVQKEILKDLELELKKEEGGKSKMSPEDSYETQEMLNLLETKTIELKSSLMKRKQGSRDTIESPDHASSPINENVPVDRTRHPTLSISIASNASNSGPSSPRTAPIQLSSGSMELFNLQPLKPMSAANSAAGGSLGESLSASGHALKPEHQVMHSGHALKPEPEKSSDRPVEIFDMEVATNKPDSRRGSGADAVSGPQPVTGHASPPPQGPASPSSATTPTHTPQQTLQQQSETANKLEAWLEEGSQELEGEQDEDEDSWDNPNNLGTIQELPELGYQSDSSETDQLLKNQKRKKSTTPMSDTSSMDEVMEAPLAEPELATVPEHDTI